MRSLPLGGVVAGVIALNGLGGSAMAATAPPKPQDVAAARAVVLDFTRFDQTALGHEGAMTAAAKAMVAQVQTGCPGAIPASIVQGTKQQQGVYFDLVVEGALDLSIHATHPLNHATAALSKGLDRIHFSSRTFTRRVHDAGKAQQIIGKVKPSDLCADVKAAATGGFVTDAPGTMAFLKGIDRLDPGPTASVAQIIKRTKADLLTHSDRASLTRLKKVDARFVKFGAHLGATSGAKLGKVLLSAPPPSGTGGFPTNPPPPSSDPAAASTLRAAMLRAFAVR